VDFFQKFSTNANGRVSDVFFKKIGLGLIFQKLIWRVGGGAMYFLKAKLFSFLFIFGLF